MNSEGCGFRSLNRNQDRQGRALNDGEVMQIVFYNYFRGDIGVSTERALSRKPETRSMPLCLLALPAASPIEVISADEWFYPFSFNLVCAQPQLAAFPSPVWGDKHD